MVTPFLVHHGRLFSQPPTTTPAPEPSIVASVAQVTLEDAPADLEAKQPPIEIIQPYMCFAFRFVGLSLEKVRVDAFVRIQEDIVYIADCGAIPDEAWSSLLPASGRQLSVCILDCLHLRSHPSHFGLEQSVEAARKIGAKRTYLLGFSHEVAHDEYVTIGEVIGGAKAPTDPTENMLKGLGQIGEGDPIWVRPAHDGLCILLSPDQLLSDQTYG